MAIEELIMSLASRLFPEGNLQEIKANSTSQKDYNINATKDMLENVDLGILSNPLINRLIPFDLAKEIMAPGTALTMSPVYDGMQGIYRGITDPKYADTGIFQALKDENIGSSMLERFTGAAGPFADRLSNIYGFTPTFGGPQGIFAQGANFLKDRFNNNANAQGIDSLIIPNAPGSGYQAGASQFTRPAGTSQPGSGYTPDPSNYNSQPRPAGTSQPGSGYQAGASQYTKSTSKPKGGQISKKSTSYKNKAR